MNKSMYCMVFGKTAKVTKKILPEIQE